MRRKAFYTVLAAEAVLCTLLAFAQSNSGIWLTSVLSFPFEPLGRLLRGLSLGSRAGDVFAWALCVVISELPLWLFFRLLGRRRWMDALLPLASLLIFMALYLAVNPSLAGRWLGEAGALMGLALPGGAVYSTLLTWCVLRLADRMETAEIHGLARALLWALGMAFVFAAFGSALSALLREISAMRAGNTAAGQPVGFTSVVLTMGYLVEALTWLLDLWVLSAALSLLDAVEVDRKSEAVALWAGELYRRGRISLSCSLSTALCYDLLQILLSRRLLRIHTTLRLPIFSVAFLLIMLIVSRLLRENKDLRDDNDLFI